MPCAVSRFEYHRWWFSYCIMTIPSFNWFHVGFAAQTVPGTGCHAVSGRCESRTCRNTISGLAFPRFSSVIGDHMIAIPPS